MRYCLNLVFLFSFLPFVHSQQSISAKLIDSTTQKPIPFATISLNKKSGVISNSNGQFQIHFRTEAKQKDSLFISCLGYEPKQLSVLKFSDSIVVLNQKTIELEEILVSNKNYSVEEIIEKIYENLDKNYKFNYNKSTLFYRESFFNHINKKNVKVKKTSIPELNQNFADSLISIMPNDADNHVEILGELYTNTTSNETQKLDIIKASHLYDKKNQISFEGVEERLNSILKKHIKRDSYFKIKSGFFGTKEEIDSSFFDRLDKKTEEEKQSEAFLEQKRKQELEHKKNFLKFRKQTISGLQKNSFVFDKSPLDFLKKSRKYDFELLDYLFLNDDFVYKISFTPKSSADYKGIIYVNTEDFAIVRADYENVKALKNFKLLGVSYNENMHKGTFIYAKDKDSETYALKYAESKNGNKFGIKRPLKIIEKNKNTRGRRKQNEISTDIHFMVSNIIKKELVVFKNEAISESIFTAFKEKANTKPTYLPKYDPEFWKGYNVIEPNQAIKDFKSIE